MLGGLFIYLILWLRRRKPKDEWEVQPEK